MREPEWHPQYDPKLRASLEKITDELWQISNYPLRFNIWVIDMTNIVVNRMAEKHKADAIRACAQWIAYNTPINPKLETPEEFPTIMLHPALYAAASRWAKDIFAELTLQKILS